MKLHELKPAPGATRPRRRIGRGRAGDGGKTGGRGTKGAKARGQVSRNYEGGQIPLQMRLPKLPGFRSPNRVPYTVINLTALDAFEAGSVVDPEALRARGLVKKKGPVKVLGDGEISKALQVRAHAFSASATRALEAAGGSAGVIEASPHG
ncbi:MAG: 50S ribosomal protein L15 [Actinomycetota bacterium]